MTTILPSIFVYLCSLAGDIIVIVAYIRYFLNNRITDVISRVIWNYSLIQPVCHHSHDSPIYFRTYADLQMISPLYLHVNGIFYNGPITNVISRVIWNYSLIPPVCHHNHDSPVYFYVSLQVCRCYRHYTCAYTLFSGIVLLPANVISIVIWNYSLIQPVCHHDHDSPVYFCVSLQVCRCYHHYTCIYTVFSIMVLLPML